MTSVIETTDAFEIGTAGLIVASVRRVGVALVIEMRSSEVQWTLTVEGEGLGAMPAGASIVSVRAHRNDGTLEIRFADGQVFTVHGDAHYESWQLLSSAGDRLIAVPGNGIAVWRS